jgi:hypothetical protein
MLACAIASDLHINKIFLNNEVQKRSQKPIYPQTKQVRTGKTTRSKKYSFGGSTLAKRGGSLAHPTSHLHLSRQAKTCFDPPRLNYIVTL